MKRIIIAVLITFKMSLVLSQTLINPYVSFLAVKYSSMRGVVNDSTAGYVGDFDNNDYVGYKSLNFGTLGSNTILLSVAVVKSQSSQTIDIRLGSSTGTSLGKLVVAGTGSWSTFTDQVVKLNQTLTGTKDIYLVGIGKVRIANIKAFRFTQLAPPPPANPTITFTAVPANSSTATTAQIAFNVVTSSTNRQIQCAYDAATFSNCVSPVAIVSPVGAHVFQVKAIDVTNNLTTIAKYSWTVVAATTNNYLPYVNLSLVPPPDVGTPLLMVKATTEIAPAAVGGVSSFRIQCRPSHMANNDPIVFPGKPGASHHHTFFGNTTADAFSTNATLTAAGNSTCDGGIMNRSSYWVPSMIDTATGAPIKPLYILVYYKSNPATVTVPPPGLRMIVHGSANPKGPAGPYDRKNRYTCNQVYETRQEYIANCASGQTLDWMLVFPQCWDGKNLDSPDHVSHMAFKQSGVCPSTHPVEIPQVTYNVHWRVGTSGTSKWRLASDNYPTTSPGGYSGHGDWMNGWDPVFMTGFVKNCLTANKDCHAHLLGDGRMFHGY